MLTKTVYQYLGTDFIVKGVYDWLFKEDSGILGKLPRKIVTDNGVKYNVETTYPQATWTDVGDVIPENAGAFAQRSAALYNLIHDIDVDKCQIAKDKTQNKEAVEIMRQMRGFLNTWQDTMIHGQTTTSTSTKQMKGLLQLLAEIEGETKTDLDGAALDTTGNNSQFILMSATSSALTIAGMEVLQDAVKLGVDGYIMSRKARRYLNSLTRASGYVFAPVTDKWNHQLNTFNNAPIYINDHLLNNHYDATSSVHDVAAYAKAGSGSGYDNPIIFAFNASEDGLHIIQTGDIEKEPRFTVPNKDAWRHRVKWYNGMAVLNKYAIAGLHCLPAAS